VNSSVLSGCALLRSTSLHVASLQTLPWAAYKQKEHRFGDAPFTIQNIMVTPAGCVESWRDTTNRCCGS
jgi:hypothetical protein